MKKNEKISKKKIYAVAPVVLLALMILASVIGIFVFRAQYDKNILQDELKEYRRYSKYYAMITSNDKADFWQAVYNGAKSEGDATDAYVELFAGDIGTGFSMKERLEIAIASDVDGIILEGEDTILLRRTIQKAVQNGIPIVTVSQDITDTPRISFVGASRYDLGQAYGKETVKLAKQMLKDAKAEDENLKVMVLISRESDSAGQNLLLSGIKEEIAKEPDLANCVTVDPYTVDDSGAFSAEESIRDLFVGENTASDILICLSEIHTNCAYQAVIDYNRVGKTNIIGYYDSQSILNAVKKEVIFSTISMDTSQMGKYCVDALDDYIDEGYVSDYYAVDTYIVGQDNVNEYWKGEE